ncbi:MAG: endonuclease III [Proteobacteria bacterium]|nr:endonuclease III [Pseudomonadota bacterium]
MDNKEKVKIILQRLENIYPEAKTALNFQTPFQLLVATILSAQTTDERVNIVTEKLFKKMPTPEAFSKASLEEIMEEIKSVNFYKNKARNIKACSEKIIKEFGGKVPNKMEDLIKLPGVARKTANIVLSEGYGINEGIAVDTHVKRLSQRLGLSKNNEPEKIEKDLMEITPKERWRDMSNLLILHGRKICQAKKPNHKDCILFDICPSRNI